MPAAFRSFESPKALAIPQSCELVEAWVCQSAAPGGIVVVMQLQRLVREYFLDQIASLNLDRRRLRLSRHGRFDLSGRSVDLAGNALLLCVPTVDLLEAAISGRTWLGTRAIFRRPLSLQERHLAELILSGVSREAMSPTPTPS